MKWTKSTVYEKIPEGLYIPKGMKEEMKEEELKKEKVNKELAERKRLEEDYKHVNGEVTLAGMDEEVTGILMDLSEEWYTMKNPESGFKMLKRTDYKIK